MSSDQRTILFLNHSSVFGGAERVTLVSMQQAREAGYRPLIACPGEGRGPDAFRDAGFEVVPMAFTWMQHTRRPADIVRYLADILKLSRRVEALCREEDVGLLHAVSPVAGLYAVRAAKRLSIPYILHVHDAQPPKSLRRKAILWQAPHIRRFVCVSECVRQMVCSLGISLGKTSVLHNAVDESFLSTATTPSPAVTGNGPHVGMFGQVARWKGQAVFLEAVRRIAEKHPAAHFHIVGDVVHPDDRSYFDEIALSVREEPLNGRVTLWGYRPDVREMMAAMDVVIHASLEPEAFGLVVAEAMALGRYVIATRTGGPAEIIEDGVTGRLVEPNNSETLAASLDEALVHPDSSTGIRAAQSVRERFSPAELGKGLMRIYDEVLRT